MTKYYEIPEQEILLDWYAGATAIATSDRAPDDWLSSDVALAFSDLGVGDGDSRVRGQLVMYSQDIVSRAISLEIDPDDARKVATFLLQWADDAELDEPVACASTCPTCLGSQMHEECEGYWDPRRTCYA